MKTRHEIRIGDKDLVLVYNSLSEDLDIDTILKIDHKNIVAEILTFPVLLNKLGLLLADVEEELKRATIDMEVYEHKKTQEIRDELNDLRQIEKLTQDDIKYKQRAYLYKDKVYIAKQKSLAKLEKNKNYLNSVYWAAKDKSDKLNKISEKFTQEDVKYQIDNIASEFNSVLLKKSSKFI